MLRAFCEDEEIQPEDLMKAAEREFMGTYQKDIDFADRIVKEGKV